MVIEKLIGEFETKYCLDDEKYFNGEDRWIGRGAVNIVFSSGSMDWKYLRYRYM